MTLDQMSFFSEADPLLDQAEEVLKTLDFKGAEALYRQAKLLDPWISNIDSMLNICDFLKVHFDKTSDIATFLGSAWVAIPKAVADDQIRVSEVPIVEEQLARMACQYVPDIGMYIDQEEQLHWGNVYIHLAKYHDAHKHILETLYSGYGERADLWAYYGDVCFLLNRKREAEGAYARALMMNPHVIDYFRLVHPDLRHQLHALYSEMERESAQAILLFYGWRAGCIFIPTRSLEESEDTKTLEKLLENTPQSEAERLHLFSACLYFDQSRPKNHVNYEVREKMKDLDSDLFDQFIDILQTRENQIRLF